MRYLVTVRYNGARYFGWQKQKDVMTVQGEIEKVLSTYFDKEVTISGSGRTDAKVHGIGQTFHFDGPLLVMNQFLYSINKMLPSDIELLKIKRVKDDFHARFNAKEKVYRYAISLKAKDPFNQDFKLFYPYQFDFQLFKNMLSLFKGRHNFGSFTSKPDDEENFYRTVYDVKVKRLKNDVIVDFFGNGFMNGQVRMMIGSALGVASGKIDQEYITSRLDSNDRNITSYKVEGQGLYLIKVKY